MQTNDTIGGDGQNFSSAKKGVKVRVLVTGGTGFVGRHLVPRLVDAGHEVRLLARGVHRHVASAETTTVTGDVVTGAGLAEAMHDVDAVIHLVAVIREIGAYTFDRVNHRGIANVISAMQAAGISRLVHMSALGASPDPRFPYTYSKWRGEEQVLASKLDHTIFRPSILFGRDSDFLESLRKSARMLPVLTTVPGSGRTRFQPIWVEDVVTCLLLALVHRDAVGKIFEIGGPEYLSYEQMLDQVMRAAGIRRIKVHVPLALLRPGVTLMQRLLPSPPVTIAELDMLQRDNSTSLDAVARQFGFSPARFEDKMREWSK